jgi:hypothetical protein
MTQTPIIPRISRVKLVGYQPLFIGTIEFEIKSGCFLILGGNGLGKTTILQSIVYCIAGEADQAIEVEKSSRWNRNYFRGRLRNPDTASVEVEFDLGEHKIVLGRGFRTKNLLYFGLDGTLDFEEPRGAEQRFEQFLREKAAYPNLDDFRYMIHKLCYLPENRASLVWNSEAQIRLIMLMFGDIIDEAEFRTKRRFMKEYDSKRRHINVHLNNAKRELEARKPLFVDSSALAEGQPSPAVVLAPSNDSALREYPALAEHLGVLTRLRVDKQKELMFNKQALSSLASEIEVIQDQLAKEEEAFVLHELNRLESNEARLAIHKLLHRKQCPACGSDSNDLSIKAQQYVLEGRCPLCGIEHKFGDTRQLPLLDAELSEKLRSRISLEEKMIQTEQEFEQLQAEEGPLRLQYDEYRIAALSGRLETTDTVKGLQKTVLSTEPGTQETLEERAQRLQSDYDEADSRFDELKRELHDQYSNFNRLSRDRIGVLGRLYQQYATAFLGIPCELELHQAPIEFLDISLYVPKFDDQIRATPESCSEAQRFFLDIAFRMAMIDLCYRLGDSRGSFICETPENALDIAYVDNVAEMFRSFSRNGHVLLATSNLQPGALAGPLLAEYTLDQRKESTLNLLEYGVLSKVQKDHLVALNEQLNHILVGGKD